MADLPDARRALRSAQGAQQEAARAAKVLRETLARARDERARLARALDPKKPETRRALEQAEQRVQELGAAAEKAGERVKVAAAGLTDAALGFGTLSDPRKGMVALSASLPILMFPLRLETRFRTVTVGRASHRELWVRIYPDDCLLDAFDPMPSTSELESVRRYWVDRFRAGKLEAEQRGAWRGLVASVGSGRAGYLLEQFQAQNSGDEPAKAATDIVLVVVTDVLPPEPERAPLLGYFEAVWRADGDAAAENAAVLALNGSVGTARSAELRASYAPENADERPPRPKRKSDVTVRSAFLLFPPLETIEQKQRSWAEAARVGLLPERFLLIGYAGDTTVEVMGNPVPPSLACGPNPSAPDAESFRQEDGKLVVPDELAWMFDFERAVAVGMGFKVRLNEATEQGFDRLVAVGVRLSADEVEGATELETLLEHHRNSRNGLGFVPQGTPTNNDEAEGAGFTRYDEPDASYDLRFAPPPAPPATPSWLGKRDGAAFAELLGLRPEVTARLLHADGTDAMEARAMNTALFPATLGYSLGTMLHPLLDTTDVEHVRSYFTSHVSGRGPLPALRVGRQPYGVLPTTAFSRITRQREGEVPGFLARGTPFERKLERVLSVMDSDFEGLVDGVAHVGRGGDPQQLLLDILGLHPTSVEYHQRYAESFEDLFNRASLMGFGALLVAGLTALGYVQSGMDLLERLGYSGTERPDVLEKLFIESANLLSGPVVDDVKLSETTPIRAYTTDDRNYVQWLAGAARTSLDTVRAEQGFEKGPPRALLYILLRHALLNSAWESSLILQVAAAAMTREEAHLRYREPAFVHVKADAKGSESRFAELYKSEPRVTDHPSMSILEYLPTALGRSELFWHARQVEALEFLADKPTARLERVFAEHIDTCSYRLDAWRLGLVNARLETLRSKRQGEQRRGLYLGAYGWLEDVRPKGEALEAARVPKDLEERFVPAGSAPLRHDPTNGGYIHAPSLNHAVTAAVLRAGYLANAGQESGRVMAVNLSSERVRRALAVFEGMRGGQGLGALLGYQLERGLHDRHALAEVDQFVFALRRAFPLRSNRIATTADNNPGTPIEALEARNVVDGVALVEHVQKPGNRGYPFNLELPGASAAQASAIDLEIDRLLDTHDAVADLGLSEAVYQTLGGNYDRAAAALDTVGKGGLPPDPEVIRTPRSGRMLTHRVALMLETGVAPSFSPYSGVPASPRSKAQPALNKWLASRLPLPEDVAVVAAYFDPATSSEVERTVTLADLGLQPLDFLFLVPLDDAQAMGELDDRILRHVITTHLPRADVEIHLRYTKTVEDKLTFFQLGPLVKSLRSLVLASRPLRPTDVMLPNEAQGDDDAKIFVERGRISQVTTSFESLRSSLSTWLTALEPKLAAYETARAAALLPDAAPAVIADYRAKRAALLAGFDVTLSDAVDRLMLTALHGLVEGGWGMLVEAKRSVFLELRLSLRDVLARFQGRLDELDLILNAYDSGLGSLPEAELSRLLDQAERLVSATITVPAPVDRRAHVAGKRGTFDAKRLALAGVLAAAGTSLGALVTAARAELPLDAFDVSAGFDVTTQEETMLRTLADLAVRMRKLHTEVDRRAVAGGELLVEHDAQSSSKARAAVLVKAGKLLLGEDLELVPELELPAERSAEWSAALAAGAGSLMRHLSDTAGVAEPLDDWLHGLARVREKLKHWETLLLMAGPLGRPEPELSAAQLPHVPDDYWLGLEFPPDHPVESDHLLLTAHYAVPFSASSRQAGLLLDEWQESIPVPSQTTGLVFHYDRPSAEAPQTLLLAVSPRADGAWTFDDLVATLNETLELAKKRAVEPSALDATSYARLLPATITAVTLRQISLSAPFIANMGLFQTLGAQDG